MGLFDDREERAGGGDLILPGRFLVSPIPHWDPWHVTNKVPNTLRGRQEGHICFWNPQGQQWGIRDAGVFGD